MTAAIAGGIGIGGRARRRTGRVHIGSLNVPVCRGLVDYGIMVTLVACAGIGTLVHAY